MLEYWTLINACFKWLKASLALGVKKIGSPIALIVGIRVEFPDLLFFDFLDLDEFLIVSLTLLLPPPTTLLLPALNVFRVNFSDDLIIFNIKVSDIAILLKPQMKR